MLTCFQFHFDLSKQWIAFVCFSFTLSQKDDQMWSISNANRLNVFINDSLWFTIIIMIIFCSCCLWNQLLLLLSKFITFPVYFESTSWASDDLFINCKISHLFSFNVAVWFQLDKLENFVHQHAWTCVQF